MRIVLVALVILGCLNLGSVSSEPSSTHHVTFTFELINGSLVPVVHRPKSSGTDSGPALPGEEEETSGISGSFVAAIVIATILFNVTFVGSILIIVTVWSSLTLSR